jgi:hypothetical protein
MERECKNEIHVVRTNDFGVTWCLRCGRLFNKSVDKKISITDRILFKINHYNKEDVHKNDF